MSNYTSTGWSNHETWALNLRYDEIFADIAEHGNFDDAEDLAGHFQATVEELEFNGVKEGTLAYETLSNFLAKVDWEELAAHYYGDMEEILGDEDDERFEAMAQRLAE